VLTVRVTSDRDPGRLVNGEAVEVDVRFARLGSRALALLLDIGVQLVLVIFLMLAVLLLSPTLFGSLVDDAFLQTAFIMVLVTVFIAYPTTMETLTNGRSLGKRALGLRVVREDGGPIRLRHALTRTLVGVAVEWPGLIMPLVTWVVSMLTMIFSPHGRRLGDLAAGTFVVHERSSSEWGWMPAMPPPLAGWAATLDLSDLDDDLALATRHFLARSADIRQPYYSRFAYGLAEEVAAKIPQPPPPGTPPWLYLAAVLAERRRRAGLHVYATRALTDRIWPGFGRLDRFAPSPAVAGGETRQTSHAIRGGDAEQTQPIP
jgi:uncharacterized RDD family membrane protein YckC